MKSKFIALGIIALVGFCVPMNAKAVVCANSPDGIHHFSSHQNQNYGYYVSGSHQYKYAETNGKVEYRTCATKDWYYYCMNKCSYCGTIDTTGGTHTHYQYTEHSVNH